VKQRLGARLRKKHRIPSENLDFFKAKNCLKILTVVRRLTGFGKNTQIWSEYANFGFTCLKSTTISFSNQKNSTQIGYSCLKNGYTLQTKKSCLVPQENKFEQRERPREVFCFLTLTFFGHPVSFPFLTKKSHSTKIIISHVLSINSVQTLLNGMHPIAAHQKIVKAGCFPPSPESRV
jgi:hypothetical protein